ncbi:Alpha/Beta hydrolase protein [Trichoderma compactum]
MDSSPIVVDPATGHTHTVIMLHGRDSEAREFATEFFECEATETKQILLELFPTVRWVFPQANVLHSERFGIEMSQWFDMWSVEDQQERTELQVPGLRSSASRIAELIRQEELLVPRSSIYLGGISQGFAIALAAFFADGRGGFAGLCGFSSWLPLANQASSEIELVNEEADQKLAAMQRLYLGDDTQQMSLSPQQLKSTPILLEHCRDDDIISVQSGLLLRDFIDNLGLSVVFHEYESGGHWFNELQGMDDFVVFLRKDIKSDHTNQVANNLCDHGNCDQSQE